jgi:hypothetical protein
VPFIVWHAYRARQAMKNGAFETLGDPVDRASEPAIFWFCVVRQLLLSLLFIGPLVSPALKPAAATLTRLFGGYLVVYVTIARPDGLVRALVVELRAQDVEPALVRREAARTPFHLRLTGKRPEDVFRGTAPRRG